MFIANQPGWRYRNLRPLTASDLAELKATRQYDKKHLQALETSTLQRFDENSHLMRVNGPDGSANYIWESLPLKAEGWTLHLLRKPQFAFEDQRNAGLAAAGSGWRWCSWCCS